jgi:hypothetical protein
MIEANTHILFCYFFLHNTIQRGGGGRENKCCRWQLETKHTLTKFSQTPLYLMLSVYVAFNMSVLQCWTKSNNSEFKPNKLSCIWQYIIFSDTGIPNGYFVKFAFFFYYVGYEGLTVVTMKSVIFWVLVSCSLVEIYQNFRRALMYVY